MSKEILVTGGTGFIGSHTVVELLNRGYSVVIVDNLANSEKSVIDRIYEITGIKPILYEYDITDLNHLSVVFDKHDIEYVIHFAGLKAVAQSVLDPLSYYFNNVLGTINLLKAMEDHHVYNLIFSSSATVYGADAEMPLREFSPVNPVNPYGRTKLAIENICRDISASNVRWKIALLRYFNPVGAHNSGLIGENPQGVPNNLFPLITQVANGIRSHLSVFGTDYPTPDGTGIRDYIHVVDLALGHIQTISYLETHSGIHIFNLGTGNGYSVMEVIRTFENVNHKKIPVKLSDRRPGDVAICYSDPTSANRELGWVAQRDLEEMCADAWRFQKRENGQHLN
jgi:UDP-glucose 4-epimerase